MLFGASLVLAAFILHKDLAPVTDTRTTVPIISEVKGTDDEKQQINEALFTMELPSDWVLDKRVQERWANFYEWKSPNNAARRLRLHIDIIPASYKITRLLPITPVENRFQTGNVSGECIDFAPKVAGNNTVEARWENVLFVCDPITANQTIGTGTKDSGISARLGGHTYFFYYEDHNIRPDDRPFIDAVKSFKIR